MPQPPDSPIKQRLRTVRRRITAAVLATFLAAWLAVAAFGKGGATTTTAAPSASPSTGASGQTDGGSLPQQGSDGWGGGADDQSYSDSPYAQGNGDSGAAQSAPSGPVTTSQS